MIKIALIAYPEAPKKLIDRGEKILHEKINKLDFEIVDENPDALFVVSGGSEMQAKKLLTAKENVIILAMTENNSYAAASEIKAYCNHVGINSILMNLDTESHPDRKIRNYTQAINAYTNIKDYKVGLIGNISEWLINSTIDDDILKNRLGLTIEKIQWNDFPKYTDFEPNKDFVNHFQANSFDLTDSSKVYNLLQDMITKKQLDAITVECFPLVRENQVTACLALSKFNESGTPAGCEGDITSITGKIILKELTGQIPWMANLASIEKDKIFFAHCTIASNLVADYKVTTHFETNQGTAIQGQFKYENATVFRLSKDLTKAFLSYGRITERPEREDSCRTQIKIELPVEDINKLKENPLGNHHLVLPGDHRMLIKCFLEIANMKVV